MAGFFGICLLRIAFKLVAEIFKAFADGRIPKNGYSLNPAVLGGTRSGRPVDGLEKVVEIDGLQLVFLGNGLGAWAWGGGAAKAGCQQERGRMSTASRQGGAKGGA